METTASGEAEPANMDNYIDGVMTMLLHAVKVECLSYKSLKGFIFEVDVGKDSLGNVRDELQFFTASRGCIDNNIDKDCIKYGKKYGNKITSYKDTENVPISKFLLKLTFLKKNEKGSLNLPGLSAKLNEFENLGLFDDSENQRKIRKQKDEVKTFEQEAQVQQTLFKQEFLNDPVTYGILAACQIESSDSMYLLHLLRSKANDPLTYQVIQAMVESRECKCPIGLIAMEYGENYEVLSEHVKLMDNETTGKNSERQCKLYANIFFKMLLLLGVFEENANHYVHMDLHQNNIMVFNDIYTQNDKLINNIYNINLPTNGDDIYNKSVNFNPFTYIIDFGRIKKTDIDIITDLSFGHLKQEYKEKNNAGSYTNRQQDINLSKEIIKKIVKYLLKEEFNYYKENFGINFIQSLHLYEDILEKDSVIENGENIVF